MWNFLRWPDQDRVGLPTAERSKPCEAKDGFLNEFIPPLTFEALGVEIPGNLSVTIFTP
jgi:hypothetical protein